MLKVAFVSIIYSTNYSKIEIDSCFSLNIISHSFSFLGVRLNTYYLSCVNYSKLLVRIDTFNFFIVQTSHFYFRTLIKGYQRNIVFILDHFLCNMIRFYYIIIIFNFGHVCFKYGPIRNKNYLLYIYIPKIKHVRYNNSHNILLCILTLL